MLLRDHYATHVAGEITRFEASSRPAFDRLATRDQVFDHAGLQLARMRPLQSLRFTYITKQEHSESANSTKAVAISP